MKALRLLLHVGVILLALFCILGIPFLCSGTFSGWLSGDLDALTAATVTLDQPSGNYVVLLNRDVHPDEAKLEDWVTFFEGGEDFTYIFEDITCAVPAGDSGALEMAQSYQSQLPEHQMVVKRMDSTLLLSRAEYGRFDIIILSQEFAQANTVEEDAMGDNILLLRVKGGAT